MSDSDSESRRLEVVGLRKSRNSETSDAHIVLHTVDCAAAAVGNWRDDPHARNGGSHRLLPNGCNL